MNWLAGGIIEMRAIGTAEIVLGGKPASSIVFHGHVP
jgi:hypothetical protein